MQSSTTISQISVIGIAALLSLNPLFGTRAAATTSGPVPTVITNTSANPVPTQPANTPTTPLFIRNIDTPGLHPYQGDIAYYTGNGSGYFQTSSSFTVPAGETLVIEGISAEQYASTNSAVLFKVTTTAGGVTVTHYIGEVGQSKVLNNYCILPETQVKLYADPGSTVTIQAVMQTPPGNNTGFYTDVTISGHVVVQ